MNRPTGGEPERHVDSPRVAPSSRPDEPSSAAVQSPTTEGTAAALPPGGHLVWIPPQGDPREVTPSALQVGDPPVGEQARACPDCDATRSVETIVREHADCGRVSPEGFLGGDGEPQFVCPKCESTRAEGSDAFGIVATVHSCLRCGRILDRPLCSDD